MFSSRVLTGTAAAAVMALSAAAFSSRPVVAAESHAAVVHSPLLKPVRLDKSNAQLKLVQVVFRYASMCSCLLTGVSASPRNLARTCERNLQDMPKFN